MMNRPHVIFLDGNDRLCYAEFVRRTQDEANDTCCGFRHEGALIACGHNWTTAIRELEIEYRIYDTHGFRTVRDAFFFYFRCTDLSPDIGDTPIHSPVGSECLTLIERAFVYESTGDMVGVRMSDLKDQMADWIRLETERSVHV